MSKPYAVSYEHNGSKWSLEFYAESESDAKEKVRSIRRSLQYDGGPIAMSIKVGTPGPLVRAWQWLVGK